MNERTNKTSNNTVVIRAVQQALLQIVPTKSVSDPAFQTMNKARRREYAEKESKRFNNSDRNRTQRARDCIYVGSQFLGDTNVLRVDFNADIEIIENKLNPTHLSVVGIRYVNAPIFFESSQEFGRRLDWKRSDNCRHCPEGSMLRFGCRLGSGRHVFYCDAKTKYNIRDINKYHKKMNIEAKGIAMDHLPDAYEEISGCIGNSRAAVPDFLGGFDGLSLEMIVSRNLGCESHVDNDLANKCISIWTVARGTDEDPDGSYFILPYLTCEYRDRRYNGIVIKLRQGCAIEWDGRFIFHASSSPSDPLAIIYGNWFGVTRV